MSETTKARILAVDDEEVIRELVARVLMDEGYNVVTAADGEEAVRKAVESKPDLILLDIFMPKLDGIAVCKKLRAQEATRNARIIMLTAYNTRDRLEESIAAGADDFLGKPIDTLELKIRVRSILKVKSINDQVQRLMEYVKSMEGMRGESSAPKKSKK